jgi:DNA-binding NarL/FixJ family response regulator
LQRKRIGASLFGEGTMKTAVIIEDQILFSDLLMRVLKREAGVEQIEVFADGKSGLEAALRIRPEIILIDLYLPGLSGMEVLRQLRSSLPASKIVMMTAFETPELVDEFKRSGADGFIAKHSPFAQLLAVIERLKGGGLDGAPERDGHLPISRERSSHTALTPREIELLRYVAQGFSTKEIAGKMAISFKTAQTHRANLMRKLDIHEVATLTRYAIHRGLVGPTLDGAGSL